MRLRFVLSILIGLLVYILPYSIYAQSHVTRLQIPVSSTTIQLEKHDNSVVQKILIQDHLSSTKVIISDSEEVLNNPIYFPYGSSIEQTSLSDANRQYTGQRKVSDDSTVYNYNARYYNPTTGIFIQPDSVEGPTRYSYVAGNPIMGNDPSGNQCQSGFGQRCQGALGQQLNLNGEPAPYYGANKEFPIEGVGFMMNLLEFSPPVGALAGAYEAISGKSFPEGDSIGLSRRIIGGVAGGLGGAYAANIGGGFLNKAIQTTRVERMGGKALLAAQNTDEAVTAIESLNTGMNVDSVDMAKFLLHEEPGFNMTISASEARAIQRLKETKTLGVHNWRSPNNPKGGMSFLRGNAAEDLADVKHEAVHLLQDFTGHAWGGVYSGRIPYPSAQAKLLLFDAENMAYAATSIGRSNSSLLQQTASAFGSVGYYFPGFSDYVYTLQNADEILSNVSRLPSIQGVNTNNK